MKFARGRSGKYIFYDKLTAVFISGLFSILKIDNRNDGSYRWKVIWKLWWRSEIYWTIRARRISSVGTLQQVDGSAIQPQNTGTTRRRFLTYQAQCIQCDGSASISELSNQESAIKRQQRLVENSAALQTTVEAASSLFIAFTVVIFCLNLWLNFFVQWWQWWCSCAFFDAT